jgi:Mannosyltransferase putative/galactosyl transferase GMA12/MNN10 family/Glycosyltransferase family 9 (heptosyltransferase)
MLTAAVRDLHLCYPGCFLTDIRTSCAELWEHNPYLTPLRESDSGVEMIDCSFPLVERANQEPYHFIHGFIEFLNERLDLRIRPSAFRGDIHLSSWEKSWISQVQELTGEEIPFWLVAAGGKYDYTIKWWSTERYQEVIDHFRGRIQFVQIGEVGHHHPKLTGVIDLRGQTTLRQLVRLVYHAQGVLCGVTSLMHLAAAVESRAGQPPHRPCVVVAGGREPVHWEAYPSHQFVHRVGALACCAHGGCWRSRTVALHDGSDLDTPENLCLDVVESLPRCMHMITSADIIRGIEHYFDGGALEYLSPLAVRLAKKTTARQQANSYDEVLTRFTARRRCEEFVTRISEYPGNFKGRGVIVCAGSRYFPCAWVCLHMLRRLGCALPVQLWYRGKEEFLPQLERLLRPLQVQCVNAAEIRKEHPVRILDGWELKTYSLIHSPFKEVLLLDADNVPVLNPEFLFETSEFKEAGAIFWPDFGGLGPSHAVWDVCGVDFRKEPAFESGQIVVDKRKCWKALQLCLWYNEHSDFYYEHTLGDKETFHMAFRKLGQEYAMPSRPIHRLEGTMCQHDFRGRRLFQHRNTAKWSLFRKNKRIRGFKFESECLAYLDDLRQKWDGDLKLYPVQKSPRRLSADQNRRRRRVTLVMLYDSQFSEIGRMTSARLREYAGLRSYQCEIYNSVLDPDRHPSWSKILAIKRAILSRVSEWILWCDADAYVANLDCRVEEFIAEDCDVIFSSDTNGLNAGVFLARCCPWTIRFLDAIYALGEIDYELDPWGNKWEQNTIKHLLHNFADFKQHIGILPPYEMSTNWERFRPGDFIVHLMGLSNEKRLEVLHQFCRGETGRGAKSESV